MNRIRLLKRLTHAEERVALVERLVARQRELVASLARDGVDTGAAEWELETLQQSLRSDIETRNRLRKEVDDAIQAMGGGWN